MEIKINLSEYKTKEVESQVIDRVTEWAQGMVESMIVEAISGEIARQMKAVTEQLLREKTKEILEQGWVKTDTWGNPSGERVSLEGHIASVVFKKTGDSYGNRTKQSIADAAVHNVIATVLDKELKTEKTAMLADLRERMKETISGAEASMNKDVLTAFADAVRKTVKV